MAAALMCVMSMHCICIPSRSCTHASFVGSLQMEAESGLWGSHAGGVEKKGVYAGRAGTVRLPRAFRRLALRGGGEAEVGEEDQTQLAEGIEGVNLDEKLSEKDEKDLKRMQQLIKETEEILSNVHELKIFQKADATNSTEDDSLREAADMFDFHMPTIYRYARYLHTKGKHEKAAEYYAKAITCEHKPSWNLTLAHALCNYAVIEHQVTENFTRAEELYKQALDLCPDHLETLCNFGRLLDGGNPYTWKSCGSTRLTLKLDPNTAQAMYEKALRLDPDHVPTLNNYAYFLQRHREKNDEARALYARAMTLDPNNTVLLRNYAGFLCNVEEPYNSDTLMPIYFNTTCNDESNFDRFTGLPINPVVDRPVDRARALYNRVLEIDTVTWVGQDPVTKQMIPNMKYALMHGMLSPALAPEVDEEISNAEAQSYVDTMQQKLDDFRKRISLN